MYLVADFMKKYKSHNLTNARLLNLIEEAN